MVWEFIKSSEDLAQANENSFSAPILIFKHSATCSISAMVKMRLESKYDLDLKPYFLDLLKFRSLSNEIAEKYNVHHESPQVIMVYKGDSFYDASHFDISVEELKEALAYESGSI